MKRMIKTLPVLIICAGAYSQAAYGQADRVVVLKVDGLPEDLLARSVSERAGGARAGRSRLPWIDRVFRQNGVWMENFYVRGLSLSSPSWSLLDTGRHLEVRGNSEYDRYTLRVYDYMNFFPFYLGYARNRRADMPGVDLLDDNHVPLLADHFAPEERYQSFQLYQRGVRWETLPSSLTNTFRGGPRAIFDAWTNGIDLDHLLNAQSEKELIGKLADPRVRYLDYYTSEYDHTAHVIKDEAVQLNVLEQLDALVGRVWSAIQTSPLASTTVLVLVSDHGMNTSPRVYSQGYDLIDWFGSAEGGAHHVVINRYPMTEFKLKGLNPFVSEVTTPSAQSSYLAGQAGDYPTAAMDLDGNERASISLRNNSLNVIHILLDQLAHKTLTGRVRRAVIGALFATLDRVTPAWTRETQALSDELGELRKQIEIEKAAVKAESGGWSAHVRKVTLPLDAKRRVEHLERMETEEHGYSEYVATMTRLLALNGQDLDTGKIKIADLIPKRSLGDPNSIGDLQHYVVGPSPMGMVAAEDGSLDEERSFRHVDYFSALSRIQVRNHPQNNVAAAPVDFIAVPCGACVWLWRSPERQALIETRTNASGKMELHYTPVAHLRQDPSGELHYVRADWADGFPLELWEDPNLNAGRSWLNAWHTEREWLEAVHRTKYSNGIIGIVEALLREPVADPYQERKRELRSFDMIVFANDHWNFDVRSFNPGGNHRSFLRISTHSVLLFAGGDQTRVPRGLRVETPYDSLSFAPTILTLAGKPDASLPGPVIREVIHDQSDATISAVIGK